MTSSSKRIHSYGESRKFKGLEKWAIKHRAKQGQQLMEKLIREHAGRSLEVVELGCGYNATNLIHYEELYPNISFTGVDLSVSHKNRAISWIEADLSSWAPSRLYDGCLSLAVLEHMLDPMKHFALIGKCLKRNGLALLTTPAPVADFFLELLGKVRLFDFQEIRDHKLYLTQGGMNLMSESAGLFIEQNRKFSAGLNQWLLLRKK